MNKDYRNSITPFFTFRYLIFAPWRGILSRQEQAKENPDEHCDGNLRAIGKLLEGKEAEEAIRLLKGNDCHGRGTSCADQLSLALEAALEEERSA